MPALSAPGRKAEQRLTSVLCDFNDVSIQTSVSDDLWLAPDDRNRSVVLVLDEQIQRSACGLCRDQS